MGNQKTKCFDYALHFIHSVPKTEKQMEIKLLEKGYLQKEIDETIKSLKKMELINDIMFTKMYIQSEAINKGKPIFKVKGKLLQKGVEKSIVEKVSSEFEEEIQQGIKQKVIKEIQKLKDKGIDGYDIMTKLYSRGYNISLLKEVVNSMK